MVIGEGVMVHGFGEVILMGRNGSEAVAME